MLIKLFVETLIWLTVMAIVLFASAGTIAWPQAWIFLIEMGSIGLVAGLWFARHDPDLLKQRLAFPNHSDQPVWDKALLSGFVALFLASFVIMALDAVRWRSTHMAPWLEVLGGLCIPASYLISCRTLAENSFAEPVVRIQRERGHKIITTGPYSIVRHPMYGGALLFLFGTPLLLGSSYGIALSLVLTAILAIRARLEERTLAAHFPEYEAYEKTVRYRFVPFLW